MYCQKCRSPLKLDHSLEDLNPAAFDLLVGATETSIQNEASTSPSAQRAYPRERREVYDQTTQRPQSPIFKRNIPAPHRNHGGGGGGAGGTSTPTKVRENPQMSFMILSESQWTLPASTASNVPPSPAQQSKTLETPLETALSRRMETTNALFSILSSRSDIDHPICVECTQLLVSGLEKRLASTTRERDAYVHFLKQQTAHVPTTQEIKTAQSALSASNNKEAAAFKELVELENKKAEADAEVALLQEESRQLDLKEQAFWAARNEFASTLSSFQNTRDSLNLSYEHDSAQLERLQRTNVYNDAFCIGHDGYFGTINGLRLGRLPNQTVEWAEINAAWGQTLLLLSTVAEKLSFTLDGYRLRPMGSTSRIEKIETPSSSSTTPSSSTATPSSAEKITILDLFSAGDIPLVGRFVHSKFEKGMVAFLECLRQLGAYVEAQRGETGRGGAGLKLPYEIRKERIGDSSIKLGFGQDEAWTRACKYTLTCCKFLLAHASNVGGRGRGATAGAG